MSNNEPAISLHGGPTARIPLASPPELWNPTASGCWSLIFTPLFGAYLHMKNWQTLAEPELAEKSRKWGVSSAFFLIALVLSAALVPESNGLDAFFRFSGIALIVSWYYAIGKSQQTYVNARYGESYIRRGWKKPLLVALFGLAIFFLVIFGVAFVSNS